jgi:hypothetical protein
MLRFTCQPSTTWAVGILTLQPPHRNGVLRAQGLHTPFIQHRLVREQLVVGSVSGNNERIWR